MLPLHLRSKSRDAIAAMLRSGDNPRLPRLTPQGMPNAEFCATLLLAGCLLPVWAYEH